MLVSFTQWAAGQVTYLCSHHLSSIKGCCFWVSCKNLFANWVLWQPSRVLRDWDQCICGSLICSPMTSSLVWLRILYFIPNGVLCEQCSLDTVQRWFWRSHTSAYSHPQRYQLWCIESTYPRHFFVSEGGMRLRNLSGGYCAHQVLQTCFWQPLYFDWMGYQQQQRHRACACVSSRLWIESRW